MEEHYLRTLELNKVLERLAGHTAFAVSRELAIALRPATSVREVSGRQAATAEARRLLDLKPNFGIGGARDVRAHLQRASIGAPLSPDELLMVASTVASGRFVRGTISKLGDQLPTLSEMALPIGSHGEIEQEIHRAISDTGEVVDSASPALATVRAELRRSNERLMAKLNEIVSSPTYRQALQEPIVTQRQGRYVVPVKAEFKGQFKGIVHDQSASGATVFMEPLVVVDLANRWRQLQVEEQQEIERILRRLSGMVGHEAEDLQRTVQALAEIDLHLAAAKLADEMKAVPPALIDIVPRRPGAQPRRHEEHEGARRDSGGSPLAGGEGQGEGSHDVVAGLRAGHPEDPGNPIGPAETPEPTMVDDAGADPRVRPGQDVASGFPRNDERGGGDDDEGGGDDAPSIRHAGLDPASRPRDVDPRLRGDDGVAMEPAPARGIVPAAGDEPPPYGAARGERSHSVLSPQHSALSSGPLIRLKNARHPLLKGHVVPISVELGGDFDILVITGPNTGGKTVALKTVGLLCLMAQCGLQIPAAEGSALGVFSAVYADIGDEQSIEQSLSTFSSHVTHIVDILAKADETSLVLLDELGAGTDPQEGSALARAILSYLLERRVPAIATTHYSELKSFAHMTPRVENASVEFDLETLSPTYRLSIGLPGRSNALAIASRLGMTPEILDGARQLLGETGVEMEGLLAQLQVDRDEARAARAEAERLRNQLRSQRARLNAELDDIEERKRAVVERAREQSEQELSALRSKVQQVLRELERSRVQREAVASVASVVKQAEALQPLRAPGRRRQRRDRAPLEELKVGQPVYVASLQKVGTVSSLPDERGGVEVQIGPLRTRVNVKELSRTDPTRGETVRAPEITYRLDSDRALHVSMQLDLRGKRVEEALEELDRYLHDAYMAGLKMVRIVHGKGTGAVRAAVREALAASALVRGFDQAAQEEGGEGATIAMLAV